MKCVVLWLIVFSGFGANAIDCLGEKVLWHCYAKGSPINELNISAAALCSNSTNIRTLRIYNGLTTREMSFDEIHIRDEAVIEGMAKLDAETYQVEVIGDDLKSYYPIFQMWLSSESANGNKKTRLDCAVF